MAAGVLLGPIVMGAAMPGIHAALFSPASLARLSALSTFGLVLFMFVIGLELRWPQGVRARIRAAANVGVASVLLPMALVTTAMATPMIALFMGSRPAAVPSRAVVDAGEEAANS